MAYHSVPKVTPVLYVLHVLGSQQDVVVSPAQRCISQHLWEDHLSLQEAAQPVTQCQSMQGSCADIHCTGATWLPKVLMLRGCNATRTVHTCAWQCIRRSELPYLAAIVAALKGDLPKL